MKLPIYDCLARISSRFFLLLSLYSHEILLVFLVSNPQTLFLEASFFPRTLRTRRCLADWNHCITRRHVNQQNALCVNLKRGMLPVDFANVSGSASLPLPNGGRDDRALV